MAEQLTAEEVFANDEDPLEAITALRKEEAGDPDLVVFDAAEVASDELIEEVMIPQDEELPETEAKEEEEAPAEEEEAPKEEVDSETDEETAKEEIIEIVKRKFKASGEEYEFTDTEMLEQFEGVFGKAVDYTQKMQKMKPYRKMISALETEGVTQDQLNLALDVLKGDKAAIKQLAKDRDIDLSDLDFDKDTDPYTPTEYGDSEFQSTIKEIESSIGNDPEYTTTVDIIDNRWDDGSRKLIADNPHIITALHNDVKSGLFAKVQPEATKLQMLDGNSKSSLDYYLLAGEAHRTATESETSQQTVDELNKPAQEAEDKHSKESSEAVDKRAASSTPASSGKKGVIDYLNDDNDEDYDKWRAKLDASV